MKCSSKTEKIYAFDARAGFEGNHRSVGYGKQCSSVWSCAEERGRALDFEVEGQWKKGRPKMTWKRQVEEESMKVALRRKDALSRSKWSVGGNKIAAGLR